MRLALLGPPGSGKGTQGAILRERFAIPHLASGDLLREAVREGTELGRRAKGFMDSGQLVPDELVLGLMSERMAHADCERGWLLDGFPRTLAQAESLETLLADRGWPLEHVVSLDVAREEIVTRLGGRRTCPDCGRLYHVRFTPPQTADRCDACGAELAVREDDREETVRDRLEVYDRQTAPLLDFYRGRGLLRAVEGTGSPEEISARVMEALEGRT